MASLGKLIAGICNWTGDKAGEALCHSTIILAEQAVERGGFAQACAHLHLCGPAALPVLGLALAMGGMALGKAFKEHKDKHKLETRIDSIDKTTKSLAEKVAAMHEAMKAEGVVVAASDQLWIADYTAACMHQNLTKFPEAVAKQFANLLVEENLLAVLEPQTLNPPLDSHWTEQARHWDSLHTDVKWVKDTVGLIASTLKQLERKIDDVKSDTERIGHLEQQIDDHETASSERQAILDDHGRAIREGLARLVKRIVAAGLVVVVVLVGVLSLVSAIQTRAVRQAMIDALRYKQSDAAAGFTANSSVPPPVYSASQLAAADAAITADDALTRARGHIVRREFDEADNALSDARQGRPNPYELNTVTGDRFYFDDRPDEAITWYREALLSRPQSAEGRTNLARALTFARELPIDAKRKEATALERALVAELQEGSVSWAKAQIALGNSLSTETSGDLEGKRHEAIKCEREALRVLNRDKDPDDWAIAQNNLGTILQELTSGNLEEHRKDAIACYRFALEIRTREACPDEWAGTQNNLGNALTVLTTGNLEQNRRDAIECFHHALDVWTRKRDPGRWALVQNNLGGVFQALTSGDPKGHRRDAIACYRASLEVWKPNTDAADWAMAENNLGAALVDASSTQEERIEAIECCNAALTVRTKETTPDKWADSMNNLGTALRDLASGNPEQNRLRAIDCFLDAERVWTPASDPTRWCRMQVNLGDVFQMLTTGDLDEHRRDAIRRYQSVLKIWTKEKAPGLWARTSISLGSALQSLTSGDVEGGRRDAIEAYLGVLEVLSKAEDPINWAITQNNLADAMTALTSGDPKQNLREAISRYRLALEVYTEQLDPAVHKMVAESLKHAEATLASVESQE